MQKPCRDKATETLPKASRILDPILEKTVSGHLTPKYPSKYMLENQCEKGNKECLGHRWFYLLNMLHTAAFIQRNSALNEQYRFLGVSDFHLALLAAQNI